MTEKEQTFTTNDIVKMFTDEKPYVLELEKIFNDVQFGECNIVFTLRCGVVEKMITVSEKAWLREKPKVNFANVVKK